jgi:hypothetical protein
MPLFLKYLNESIFIRPVRGRILKRFLLLFPTVLLAAYGTTVTCLNRTGDAALLQAAVNTGGVVSLSGTCALGPTAVGIGNKVSITGTAQLNSTGPYAFIIWSDNVSISGITFNRAGVHLIELPQQSYFTFTNNHIENTNGNDGIDVDGVLRMSNINDNLFTHVAPDGFEAASFESLGFGSCYSNGGCDSSGVGI